MKIQIKAGKANTKTLFSLLEEKGILLTHPCNKKGTCGGCKVMTDTDGEQLACQWIPKKDTFVEIPESSHSPFVSSTAHFTAHTGNINEPCLLIDLGTTTIAMALFDKEGEPVNQITFANPNASYGTDVISRIQSATSDFLFAMKSELTEEIKKQWKRFSCDSLSSCYIAGNTTMIHILMGYPCEGLATYPFTPYHSGRISLSYDSVPVTIMPAFSAFVGGDIASGLFSLHFEERRDTSLFLDLGTNGEIALLHDKQIYLSSVAAGPAFEGGNLSCGCQSIPGAIKKVSLKNLANKGLSPQLTTIANKLPVGLCGTGALSVVEELLRYHYVTSEGIIRDEFPEDGLFLGKRMDGSIISFTRDDFRQVQLAIASVRAGISTLLKEANIRYDDVDSIYLAGGFGYEIPMETAFSLHLFDERVKGKVISIGNSSLSGLHRYAGSKSSEHPEKSLEKLLNMAVEVPLAENQFYKDEFVRCMTFTK